MAKPETNAPEAPTVFLLVKKNDRVVITEVKESDLENRKQELDIVDGPFDSQQMADAALEDFLGDTRP